MALFWRALKSMVWEKCLKGSLLPMCVSWYRHSCAHVKCEFGDNVCTWRSAGFPLYNLSFMHFLFKGHTFWKLHAWPFSFPSLHAALLHSHSTTVSNARQPSPYCTWDNNQVIYGSSIFITKVLNCQMASLLASCLCFFHDRIVLWCKFPLFCGGWFCWPKTQPKISQRILLFIYSDNSTFWSSQT